MINIAMLRVMALWLEMYLIRLQLKGSLKVILIDFFVIAKIFFQSGFFLLII